MSTLEITARRRSGAPALEVTKILSSAGVEDHGAALLVITPGAYKVDSPPHEERVLWVVSGRLLQRASLRATDSARVRLPIVDCAFSVVIVHRFLRPGVDVVPLLEEALRVLAPEGRLVVVTQLADLESAPLPRGAHAQLTQRALRSIGVTNARFVDVGTSVIAVAGRPSMR